jgi:hypothetical protein
MKKWLLVIPFVSLSLSALAVTSSSISFLFVINTGQAKLQRVCGDQYRLTVPVKAIHSVLAFSDRPHRQNFRLSQRDYAKLVYVGRNSFAANPPNVALVWEDQKDKIEIYMLMGHKKVGDQIVYDLTWQKPSVPVNNASVHHGHVVLFIDPLEINELEICMQVRAVKADPTGSVSQLKSRLAQEVQAVIVKQAGEVCHYGR